MMWGQGLWERVTSYPQNSRLFTEGVVIISPNTAVHFVYNVLELPKVPVVQHCLISLFLNLYTSF